MKPRQTLQLNKDSRIERGGCIQQMDDMLERARGNEPFVGLMANKSLLNLQHRMFLRTQYQHTIKSAKLKKPEPLPFDLQCNCVQTFLSHLEQVVEAWA
jgi:hypothetical protein